MLDLAINLKAFEKLVLTEIGVREFLIHIIKRNNLKKWHDSFLGSTQKKSLQTFSEKIQGSNNENDEDAFKENYKNKIIKNYKQEIQKKQIKIYHPFYFLTWSELSTLIARKENKYLFIDELDEKKYKSLTSSLDLLNDYRNNIAHARLISVDDYNLIVSITDNINNLIFDFKKYQASISQEDNINNLYLFFSKMISKLDGQNISIDEYIELQDKLNILDNSFWFNTIYFQKTCILSELIDMVSSIINFKKMRGGSLKILKVKSKTIKLLNSLIADL